MSNIVDERIVEMQFDNRNFEKNVQESMNTIDKLNQKLKFDESKNAFSNMSKDAKKFDLSSMGNAIDEVKVRFSGMQMAFNAAIQEIVHTAFNAGKQIVEAIAITPIKSGLQEYQTYMTSIQTILSNTKSKGTTLTDVYGSLDELNYYADKTIYNFTQMTRSIGSFTAAGVGLEDATNAIKGVANLAAISGVNSEKASNSMYHFSQALAGGYLQLRNWNGIVTAGMGGEIFQEELKDTARHLKQFSKDYDKDVDALIDKYGSFRESLRGHWLTEEVLTQTLAKFAGELDEQTLRSMGYADEEITRIQELGKDATEAATKVRDFKQLIDTLNEALQSGWTMSWRLIIGDFYQAREALTKISLAANEYIGEAADRRNDYLSSILSSGWDHFIRLNVGKEADFMDQLKKVTSEAGEDVGKAFEDIVKKSNTAEEAVKTAFREGVLHTDDLRSAIVEYTNGLTAMTKEEREAAGVSQDTWLDLRKMRQEILDGTDDIDELFLKIMRPSARENFLTAILEGLNAVMSYVKPIKQAFADTFLPGGEAVWKFSQRLVEFVKHLRLSDENADKLYRIFKGLLAPIKLIGHLLKVAGEAFVTVFKALTNFDGGDVLEFFAKIADKVSNLVQAAIQSDAFRIAFEKIWTVVLKVAGAIGMAAEKIATFVKNSGVVEFFGEIFTSIWNWIEGNVPVLIDTVSRLWDTFTGEDWKGRVGSAFGKLGDFFKGLVDNFKNTKIFEGAQKGIQKISDALKNLWDRIAGGNWKEKVRTLFDALGSIFSSMGMALITAFTNIGKYVGINRADIRDTIVAIIDVVVSSLVAAVPIIVGGILQMISLTLAELKKHLPEILAMIKTFTSDIVGVVGDAVKITLGLAIIIKVIKRLFVDKKSPFRKIGDSITNMFQSIENMFDQITNNLKQRKKNKTLTLVFLIIAGIVALVGMLILLAATIRKDSKSVYIAIGMLGGIMAALLAIIITVTQIAKKSDQNTIQRVNQLGTFAAAMTAMVVVLGLLVVKLSKFNPANVITATLAVTALGGMLVALIYSLVGAAKIIGRKSTITKNMKQIMKIVAVFVVYIAVLGSVVKKLARFNPANVLAATASVTALGGLVVGLMMSFIGAMKLSKGMRTTSSGKVLAAVAVMSAMVAVLGTVVAKLAKYSPAQIAVATIAVGAIGGIVVGLMYALQGLSSLSGGSFSGGTAVTLAAMAAVIAVIGGIVVALAQLPVAGAIVGVSALAVALGVLVGFVYALQGAANSEASTKIILLLAGIGVALTGLGIACAGAGIGFAFVAKGLRDFARITHAQAEAITDTIKTIATGFIELIPQLALALGEASAMIIIGIAKYAPQFNAAVVRLIVTLLDELNKNIPKMIASISEMTIKALVILTKYAPAITDKLFDFLHVVLQKLIERVPELAQDLVQLVATIFQSLTEAFEAVDPKVWTNGFKTITVLGGLITYLSLLGPIVPLAMVAAVAMTALIGELAILIALVGKTFGGEGMLDAIHKGGEVLTALGEAFGGFVGGFLEEATATLPEVGSNLSEFADNISPFVESVKNLQGVDFGAVSALTTAILDLAKADLLKNVSDLISGFKELITGDSTSVIDDFEDFCTRIGTSLGSLSSTKTEGVLSAALGIEHLAKAYNALPQKARTSASDFLDQIADMGTGINSFVTNMGNISGSQAQQAGDAAYQVASFLNKMPSFETSFGWIESIGDGGNALDNFKKGLSGLASAFSSFGAWATLIVPEHVEIGIKAAEDIFGIIDLFGGVNSAGVMNFDASNLGESNSGLPALAKAIAGFSGESAGIDMRCVHVGKNAALQIGMAIDELSKYPDFVAMMQGNGTDISNPNTFEDTLGSLAAGLKNFSDKSNGISDDLGSRAQAVADAVDALGGSSVTSASGLIGWLSEAKDTDLDKFQNNLPKLGVALVQFSGYALGITDPEHLKDVAKAGQEVGTFLGSFPDISTFGNAEAYFGALGPFGEGLAAFSTAVENVKSAHMTNIATSAQAVVDVLTTVSNFSVNAQQLKDRSDAVATFGTNFKSYADSVSGIDTAGIIASADALKSLVDALNSAGLVDATTAGNIVAALSGLAGMSFDGFVDTFINGKETAKWAISEFISAAAAVATNDTTLSTAFDHLLNEALNSVGSNSIYPKRFKDAGEDLAKNLADGFKTSTASAKMKEAGLGMVNQALSAIQSRYTAFWSAGEFLARGFANGISGNGGLAWTAAYKIGQQAVSGLKAGTQEKSPSKLARIAGEFFGEGFIIGIDEMTNESAKSAYGMGTSAVQAMNKAIATMSEDLDSELDTQPVIRPVLDLSNVQSRSHMLTSLLSRDQAMLIGANVNSEKALEIQNGLKVPEPGDNYSFVQNNYSPKALSRIEIYRQTKNQFSAMKGLATES